MATTEEKIIEASIIEFSEFGYEGARIDRIAGKAQVNKAMIYYHYKSKENLYESILKKNLEKMSEIMKSTFPEEKASIEQIYSFISNIITFFNNEVDPVLFKMIMREFSSGGKYIRKFVSPILIQPIAELISMSLFDGIRNGRIRPINPFYTMLMVIGGIIYSNIARVILQGTPIHNMVFNEEFSAKFADNIIDVLKNGIEVKEI